MVQADQVVLIVQSVVQADLLVIKDQTDQAGLVDQVASAELMVLQEIKVLQDHKDLVGQVEQMVLKVLVIKVYKDLVGQVVQAGQVALQVLYQGQVDQVD